MKQCPNCGAQNADDSRFCTECGKEFPQGNVCPQCGASVNEGDAFCQNCGKNLNALIDEEPIQYEEEEEPKKNKFIPILAALLLLAVIGGGWFYYKSTSHMKPTELVADTVAIDSVVVDTDNVDEMVVDTVYADYVENDTSTDYYDYAVDAAEEVSSESTSTYNNFYHVFNSSSSMQHELAGTFSDDTGEYPFEISFSNRGNEVSNVEYKNVRVGNTISMICTEFKDNRIRFQGKDGKKIFVISLNNTENGSFIGSASVGDNVYDVKAEPVCSHYR